MRNFKEYEYFCKTLYTCHINWGGFGYSQTTEETLVYPTVKCMNMIKYEDAACEFVSALRRNFVSTVKICSQQKWQHRIHQILLQTRFLSMCLIHDAYCKILSGKWPWRSPKTRLSASFHPGKQMEVSVVIQASKSGKQLETTYKQSDEFSKSSMSRSKQKNYQNNDTTTFLCMLLE